MRTPPQGLTESCLLAALADGWGVDVESVEYLAVGFGSHHWRVDGGDRRWFVTVDDLDAKLRAADERREAVFNRLRAALLTARHLRDRGLSFVVAPVPTTGGEVLRRLEDRFALALYPHVRGRAHAWGEYGSRSDRLAVLDLVVAIHDTPPEARTAVLPDDLDVPHRDELARAIEDTGTAWDSGPYAAPARTLLARHAPAVERLMAHHDRLAVEARAQPERAVLTHGEPHVGNTMLTEAGWVLVDWDTTRVAPPERDLWTLAGGDSSIIDAYVAATGRSVLPSALELYRLGWDLTEIAIYIALLRRPHTTAPDVAAAWANLTVYLDPERGWPSTARSGGGLRRR